MNGYESLIQKFFFENVPLPDASPAVRFEAISAAVLGTKQRRQGPLPPPETQVAIRDAVRTSEGDELVFFLPWGSSKQADGAPLDVAEFCALRQLRLLSDELTAYGRKARFVFRIEDVTDHYLFDHRRDEQVEEYADTFARLARLVLPGSSPVRERDLVSQRAFEAAARDFSPVFYRYLTGEADASNLADIGWRGAIPDEQKQHYVRAYSRMYPGQDPLPILARYFGGTLARVKLNATAVPKTPHVGISFAHPVPGDPIARPRVYYRSVPASATHQHAAPWLSQMYLRIGEDGSVTPRYVEPGLELVEHTTTWGGVKVRSPFAVE